MQGSRYTKLAVQLQRQTVDVLVAIGRAGHRGQGDLSSPAMLAAEGIERLVDQACESRGAYLSEAEASAIVEADPR